MAEWGDKELAAKVLDKLGKLPPLVQPAEADKLKGMLAAAGRGEKFIIQGGDCAERFVDCNQTRLEKQMKLILQMGMVIEHATGKQPVCVARMAGQYGKPRSKPTEVVEGFGEIMSFKGENINGFEPTDRKWDPDRLLQGYWHSAATLNYMRGFLQYADGKVTSTIDLNPFVNTDQGFLEDLKQKAADISAKFSGQTAGPMFTAHEAMQLDLEEALTRPVAEKFYNLSAHLVWIGDRTRQITGAHVEYFRGIANPVGVKVGPSMKNEELQELLQILNPAKEEGKVMIITRYGASKIEAMLPGHIEAVKATGIPVVWQCDAVHGNGIVASNKYKTRHMDDVVSEIRKCIGIHKQCGTILGGIHLEFTGEETVTECLGGAVAITEEKLTSNYETLCDPRLNYAQAVETAFKVAGEIS